MSCACEWKDGKVVDMCGAHAEICRRVTACEVEFATDKLKEKHIQELVRKDAIIDALLEKIQRLQ
jgi:hypothetical protein